MYKILGLGILVILISLPLVNAEQRTFDDCYNGFAGGLLLSTLFNPDLDMTIDKLLDPKTKPLITDVCNFYHEKTGKWAEMTDLTDFTKKYGIEFAQKYNHTIP